MEIKKEKSHNKNNCEYTFLIINNFPLRPNHFCHLFIIQYLPKGSEKRFDFNNKILRGIHTQKKYTEKYYII